MGKRFKSYPNSGILNYELAIANRSLSDNKKALKYVKKAVKATLVILTTKTYKKS